MMKTTILKSTLLLLLLLTVLPGLTVAQESENKATISENQEDANIAESNDPLAKKFSVDVNVDSDDDFKEFEEGLEKSLKHLPITELKDFLLEKERLKNARGFSLSDTMEDVLIPIVAIVMVFGLPVFIVGLLVWSRYKRRQLIHQSISAMVEKGVEIPPHLFDEEKREPGSAMRRGVVLMGVGLGLIAFFMYSGGKGVGIGFIPLLIGAAYLVVWKLENRQAIRSVDSE